MALTCV